MKQSSLGFLLIAISCPILISQAKPHEFFNNGKTLNPVILVPGLEGSQLEAKLDKPSVVCSECSKKSDWYKIWLNIAQMLPWQLACFMDNFRMKYNRTSRRTFNNDGVQIRPYRFGDTIGAEFVLADLYIPMVGYMYNLVQTLVFQGYERNVNIRAATYDFRRSVQDNEQFMVDFKGLIEETFEQNNQTRVYLVSHSMGCLYTLYFLNKQDATWKAKHIQGFVPLAGPWAGAVLAMKSLATGNNLNTFIYPNQLFRDMERSLSSTYFLLPSKAAFANDELLTYNGKGYSIENFAEFFELFNITNGMMMYEDSKDLSINLDHPGVDVTCVHSAGFFSPRKIVYPNLISFPDYPLLIAGPGDGVVNQESLEACQRWESVTAFKFSRVVFEAIDHFNIARDIRVISYVADLVTGKVA